MIFDDEFNGSSLNTGYWSSGLWGMNGPVGSYDLDCHQPSQVTEGGGELDLNAIAQTSTCTTASGTVTEPYDSGIVSTNGTFQFAYGVIEARAWLPGSSVVTDWPGIWAVAQQANGGELDVMEGLSGQACWHYHNPYGDRPGACPPGKWTGGWHTFAADWEPGKVTWYYDGVPVGSDTNGIATSPEYLVLDILVDKTYGGPIQTPATLRLDYVRVWQH